jgi:hypothetical protein
MQELASARQVDGIHVNDSFRKKNASQDSMNNCGR